MFKNLNPSALGISGHQSELIELALTYGFAGIDLNIAEFAARARLKGMPYAKRLIESAKLLIGTFALPIELDSDEAVFAADLKKLPEYAGCAAEVGCARCTAVVAPAADTLPYHENFEFHRKRLQAICDVLKPTGVRLALGFRAAEGLRRDRAFQFIHDLDALSLLVNMVASPNLGILVDTWDIVAAGGSIENVRKLLPQQIVAVQVADMPAEGSLADLDEKTARLLPGGEGGRIDVTAFLDVLKQMAYDGPVTPKLSRTALQGRRRDVAIKQTSESLDKVLRRANPVPPPHQTTAAAVGQ
jgi:sugar phosphate isomerase/epimerase